MLRSLAGTTDICNNININRYKFKEYSMLDGKFLFSKKNVKCLTKGCIYYFCGSKSKSVNDEI
ncbi:hypothetical protein MASR2M12_17450 [Bacteroidales bacterium]